ncbi:MAG TPA: hypothetical protein VKT78_19505, partial [Fimbriimonadaceae bacterium]|nr:hypothetical protein [Fimbriimonadaceae bacterium]
MKRPQVVYPPLAAAFPVLAVFSANLSICPLHDLWAPLAISIGTGAVVWLAAWLIWRNPKRGAASATAIIAACFLYGVVDGYCFRNLLPTLPIWSAATVLFAALAGWQWRWHRLLNVVSVFLILSSVGSILFGYARIARDLARVAPSNAGGATGADTRPDIFYIILDGYGRSDQLRRVMGYDNSAFLDGLRQRGFYVASGSHSNYVQTELSLASSLNFDLIQNLLPQQAKDSYDRTPLDELTNHNAVARYLKSIGYETITITTGFPSLTFDDSDLHLGRAHRMSLLESTLAAMTPLAEGAFVGDSAFEDRRHLLNAAFSNLRTVALGAGLKPRFVFVHILAPHPPFVFNADGSPRPRLRGVFGYWDGSDFYALGNTKAQYQDGYVNQAR